MSVTPTLRILTPEQFIISHHAAGLSGASSAALAGLTCAVRAGLGWLS